MLIFYDELKDAVRQAIESPKVAATVSTATASLGIATVTDFIQGAIPMVASCAGIVGTVLLGRIHLLKHKNEALRYRILRRQAEDMGIDLNSEDDE